MCWLDRTSEASWEWDEKSKQERNGTKKQHKLERINCLHRKSQC